MRFSYQHPGHEDRLKKHQQRIYAQPCSCGSGLPYQVCCLDRHDQEVREIRYRQSLGELIWLDEDLA